MAKLKPLESAVLKSVYEGNATVSAIAKKLNVLEEDVVSVCKSLILNNYLIYDEQTNTLKLTEKGYNAIFSITETTDLNQPQPAIREDWFKREIKQVLLTVIVLVISLLIIWAVLMRILSTIFPIS